MDSINGQKGGSDVFTGVYSRRWGWIISGCDCVVVVVDIPPFPVLRSFSVYSIGMRVTLPYLDITFETLP